MKHLTIALAVLTVAVVAFAADRRNLEINRSAEGIEAVEIHAGVGEVSVTADSANTITAHVEISPKKSSFWGSRERDLDALEAIGEVRGSTLVLRLRPEQHHGVEFGEDWTVRLPAKLALKVKLGVGDVTVVDMVGDVRAELGVGDVKIEGTYDTFGDIRANCGVGDATLRTPAGRDEGEGFIAHTLRATGPGKSEIHVAAGVGDVTIRLR
ncbi:MAG: hypothetical protein ACHQQS_13340 [Thermoanaerobaculales bacterium]